MKAFIGLGNPDKKYSATRHNLGASIIHRLCSLLELKLKKQTKLFSSVIVNQDPSFVLAIPTIYMNDSGRAVQKIIHYFKIKPVDLCVIHDDLDLEIGDYKIQFDRGPAGHKGIESIINRLGSQTFYRIRVGIGHPKDNTPTESFVLRPFTPVEKKTISATVDKIIPEIKKLMGL